MEYLQDCYTYSLVITREAPVLTGVSLSGVTLTGDVTTFAAGTKEYSGTAGLANRTTTVLYTLGPKPDSENRPLVVAFDPPDDLTQDTGHQVNLNPGMNTVMVTVQSGVPGAEASKTTYTFKVTRAEAELTAMGLCAGTAGSY